MTNHRPYLLFCPYLLLRRRVSFSGWTLAPLAEHDGTWRDQAFESRAKAFLAKFQDADGKPIKSPTVIGRLESGIDGSFPGERELNSLQLAVHFATLEANPVWEPEADGSFAATTDNSDLWAQPIDVEAGHVTIERGLVVRTLSGGWRIADEEFVVRAPLELRIPISSISLDSDLLAAVYDAALRDELLAKRIATAVRWLAKSWQNSRSIGWEDRLVMLRTAFEALTGSSDVEESEATLESMFARLRDAGETNETTDHLLWSPSEAANRPFTWTTRAGNVRTRLLTDLGHWYSAFGQARHVIVHEGQVPELFYEEPGSRYNGPLFNIAERLLRESVRVALIELGHADIWQDSFSRAVSRHLSESKGGDSDG